MRASVEQVRGVTLEAIDSARKHTDDVVGTGASHLSSAVEHVADHFPALDVQITSPYLKRRTRRRRVLFFAIAGVIVAVVARQVTASKAIEANAGHNEAKATDD